VLRDYTGRGPAKARTTIRYNVVLVMLEQTLTKGEKVLVEKGQATESWRCVANIRKRCQTKVAPGSPSSRAEMCSR
jgi:uncharacterized protein YbcI